MSNRSRGKISKFENTESDAEIVANYRKHAARRRIEIGLRSAAVKTPDGVVSNDGVVTVTLPTTAKPISKIGEVSEVLGRSKISIPEFKP